ncbi:MAG: RimK family alpha-L-glutamate ligase [Clostridiales bacterium]|nr:RimK family alpha-L-glutamate ligase [Clostridiales bacterium]
MNGWLVVNCFVNLQKFNEVYEMLKRSASALGVGLQVVTSDKVLCKNFKDSKDFKRPDFVLFWDKDVILARKLEMKGIPVFNSSKAIKICDNKKLTALCMEEYDIPMPRTICAPMTFEAFGYNNLSFLDYVIETFSFPFVIKEAYGSFGQQVYLVESPDEAKEVIAKAGHKELLFQEFILASRGKDIRINVVGGKVVASMFRFNDHDFRSNITIGGKMEKIEINKAEETIALRACAAAGLDFAGVDVLFGPNNTPILCEINSNPHFKTTLECTGIDMSKHIIDHVMTKLTLAA